MKKPHYDIFRWKGLYAVGILLVGFIFYMLFFFDHFVKTKLEDFATKINGAEVNIGKVKTSFFPPSVIIKGIEITHHVRPTRNLFEIDDIHFSLETNPLLRKKLIVPEFSLKGIRFDSQRQQSGATKVATNFYGVPSLIDRVSSGFYSHIRNKFKTNPLKHLGQLLTGLDLARSIEGVHNDLATIKSLSEQKNLISKNIEDWEKRKQKLASKDWLSSFRTSLKDLSQEKASDEATLKTNLTQAHNEIQERKKELSSLKQEVALSKDKSLQIIQNLGDSLREDIDLVKDQLRLPRLDQDDLTLQLFGPEILNYLERISYWVDLSRRKMPKDSGLHTFPIVKQKVNNGYRVHYGGIFSPYPSLNISHGIIDSANDQNSSLGQVKGEFFNLTSDPPILNRPFTFNVHTDLPGKKIRDLEAKVVLDHSKEVFHDSIFVKVGSFPVKNMYLHQASDLEIQISQATGRIVFDAQYNDKGLQAHWKADFENVEYDISSRYHKIENIIRQIISPVYSFQLAGTVEGSYEDINLNVSSVLGERLALGLKHEFRHQLAAIDDTIRRNILDYIDTVSRDLSYFARSSHNKFLDRLSSAEKEINALTLLTSTTAKERGIVLPPQRSLSQQN